MPKMEPDMHLLAAINAVVDRSGGNESEAARHLGVTRLKINRVRRQQGAVTPAVRNDLWQRLERLSQAPGHHDKNDTSDPEMIQIVRDVPAVALQVLRYMANVIERDLRTEETSSAR